MSDAIPPIPELPPALREAAQLTKLIPFVGAGASKLAGCPDWNEFADDALSVFVEHGLTFALSCSIPVRMFFGVHHRHWCPR
jgi:hypothetical protein